MNFMLNHLNNIEIPRRRFDMIPPDSIPGVEMYLLSPERNFKYKNMDMTNIINNSSIQEDLGKYDFLAYIRKPMIAVWTDTQDCEMKFTNKEEMDGFYSAKGVLYSDIVAAFSLGTWMVKDSSVYSDSYYWCNTDIEYTSKVHRSIQQTNAVGTMTVTSFTRQELMDALQYMTKIYGILFSEMKNNDQPVMNYSQETVILNIEAAINSNGNNHYRALLLLQLARKTGFLAEKINWYCAILECLFGIKRDHKRNISEMTADYIGVTQAEKDQIISDMRDAYKVRSEFVHGDVISIFGQNKQLAELSVTIDDYVRRAFHKAL